MIKSMTGFGKANLVNEKYEIEIEIKTLNSKYFDFKFYSGKEYSFVEPIVTKKVKEYINRGSIECRINITDLSEPEMKINEGKLKAIWEAGKKASSILGVDSEIPLDRILLYQGIIEMKSNKDPDDDLLIKSVLECLVLALERQQQMAFEEGESMKEFFRSSLALMLDSVKEVRSIIPNYKEQIFNKIKTNIKELLQSDITDEILRRVVIEASFYVDKNDVTEEVIRLENHIEKFLSNLENDDSASGKKLMFIVQEMHREANTLGSKFSIPATFEHILVIKEEIDKCKEMILNVQ